MAAKTFSVFLHETGHLLGLHDLYPEAPDMFPYVGPWDIMSSTYQDNIPMTAWDRLLVGWVEKPEIRCVQRSTTVALTPVDGTGATKALAVRIGPSRALMVEARTDQVGRDCVNPGGVLIYSATVADVTAGRPLTVMDANPEFRPCGSERSGALFIPGTDRSKWTDPEGRLEVEAVAREGDTFNVSVTVLPTACAVPKLVGLAPKVARQRLRTGNCRPGKVTGQLKGRKRKVLAQGVGAGSVLVGGAVVPFRLARRGA